MLLLLYLIMLVLGFLVMLLVMTFNYPILLVLVLGLASGHLTFSLIGSPQLPEKYIQVAGSGAYLPDADNCCCKVEEVINDDLCPCDSKLMTASSGGSKSPLMDQ